MNIRLKLFPAFITLLAGAITSIITYCLHYEHKTAYLVLLAVLISFYIIGTVLQKLILKFEQENEQRAADEAKAQEGKVVEKDTKEQEAEAADKQPDEPSKEADKQQ